MTNKNLIVLVAVAAPLAIAALYLSSSSRPSGAKLNGEKVLGNLDVSEVSSISFSDKIALSSGENGWKIDSYYGYPASREKIVENLLKLAELKVGQVSRGVKIEKPLALRLADAKGKEICSLKLGERHPKWGRGRYALYKGESVLVSDVLDAFEATGDADQIAKRWCESKIVDEPWISFNKVVDPATDAALFGFSTGVVAKVKVGADTNVVLTVGAALKDSTDRYVKLSNSSWVYTVSSYSVESFLPKPPENKKSDEKNTPAKQEKK